MYIHVYIYIRCSHNYLHVNTYKYQIHITMHQFSKGWCWWPLIHFAAIFYHDPLVVITICMHGNDVNEAFTRFKVDHFQHH